MAYYALLDSNNIVTQVIVGVDDLIEGSDPEIWYSNFTGQVCKKTGDNIRKQYAGIGYSYDPVADVFVRPQPYPSWLLDNNFDWQPPTPQPEGDYYWDEKKLSWIEIEA